MKKVLKTFLCLMFFAISIFLVNSTYAANFNVNINCDGKKIEMTSETPEMTWQINNLLPGGSDETILTMHNVGEKFVNISFIPEIENGKDVADILEVKIIKLAGDTQKKDEEFYDGKYSQLINMGLGLESKKSQSYKIITSLPLETGNEFQNKECTIKIHIEASGVENKPLIPEDEMVAEQPDEKELPKQLVTDVVKPVQTGESRIIFVIIGVFVIAIIMLVASFCYIKKKNN